MRTLPKLRRERLKQQLTHFRQRPVAARRADGRSPQQRSSYPVHIGDELDDVFPVDATPLPAAQATNAAEKSMAT